VIVGQDWGDTQYFIKNKGHDLASNRTSETLRRLLGSIGIDVAAPVATDTGGGTAFMTNAILCLKQGGMQAAVRPEWFAACGVRFLRPTIDLIEPKAVEPDGFRLTDTPTCFPVYHCGDRILNTHRKLAAQVRDWARVGRALSEH
jgi:hypothetical protein